ncbi:hypothetical protein B0J11DRAFT_476430 [Dendryphion nanum]|uniref:GTP-binding protein EsdC n=1 Tax=Dendryphion nanum TaxID=256645 RepID=A0A9P9EJI7_9PLEO|nr:hypothetical protein B0J11DRAFT_476430 [Dendryphion nanum]
MAAIQLNFTLRTSSNCKTVHLLGSWDGYQGQLPLSKDPKKSGGWVGQFKFQGATLKQGQRYWYYYIIDGYHVSHDPAREFTTEPTTGRNLNILDIPAKAAAAATTSSRSSRRVSSSSIPKGRSISPSRIAAPRPQRPHETRQVINTQYDKATLEALNSRLTASSLESDDESDYESDAESDVPSLTSSRSSNSSSPSSVSSTGSCCTCERYGITRKGDRVRLDCGGSRCGYSDDEDCSSEDEAYYEYQAKEKATRRQGVVIRN